MSERSRVLRKQSELRRTYRKFLPERIGRETIEDWLMIASTAPSGANKQPWFFCVVTDEEMKMKIREEAEKVEEVFYREKISDEWRKDLKVLKTDWSKPFLSQAPCLILIFKEFYKTMENGQKDKNYYVNESAGLAIGLLINAIRDSGYHSLTYTPAPMTFLKDMFKRPEGETPVMILSVGKTDESYELPDIKRKTINEIAEFY
ncbi:MAG: nitroreductase family protein [Peptostreptococcaceae bacterium]|nr:nitroreductase family protein [Peptostreptococcaceae bacterium]